MNFKSHIHYIIGKVSRSSGVLYRIRDSLNEQARLTFYYSFVFPYLSYNIPIWGGTNKSHLNPLIVLQKRIIRTMCNSGFLDSSTPLFYKLGILKLEDIYKFNILLLTRKLILAGSFQTNHNVNTRNRHQAAPEFQRLSRTQQSCKYIGPKL